MSLDGWTVHWLGPMTMTAADGTTLDYTAQPASRHWNDVATLRKWISEEPARRDCQDQSDGTVYEVQVRRGSVLRLRPRARGLLPEETSKRHSSDAIPVRITGSRFGNSATSDSRPPIACT